NTTVTSNTALLNGGGLANFQGKIDLSSVTVVSNTGNTDSFPSAVGGGLSNHDTWNKFVLRNSLVALNTELTDMSPDCGGQFSSQGYNLLTSTKGCSLQTNLTGNLIGQDPRLGSFGPHDGPTDTWALQLNSPALDAGNVTGCRDQHNNILPYDQRGFPH